MIDQNLLNNLGNFVTDAYAYIAKELVVVFRDKNSFPFKERFFEIFYYELAADFFLLNGISKSEIKESSFVKKGSIEEQQFYLFYEELKKAPIDKVVSCSLEHLSYVLEDISCQMCEGKYYFSFNLLSYKNKITNLLLAHKS